MTDLVVLKNTPPLEKIIEVAREIGFDIKVEDVGNFERFYVAAFTAGAESERRELEKAYEKLAGIHSDVVAELFETRRQRDEAYHAREKTNDPR